MTKSSKVLTCPNAMQVIILLMAAKVCKHTPVIAFLSTGQCNLRNKTNVLQQMVIAVQTFDNKTSTVTVKMYKASQHSCYINSSLDSNMILITLRRLVEHRCYQLTTSANILPRIKVLCSVTVSGM